jgi:tetratricopeptide (TPR) repeat protein
VERFFTPLLRRVYAFFAAFLACYLALAVVQRSTWNRERLYTRLVSGPPQAKLEAAAELVELRAQPQLLRALKAGSPATREIAENALWEVWFRAAGDEAYRLTMRAVRATEKGNFPSALQTLNEVVRRWPTFAEGWNRRARLYWQRGEFAESLADCRKVIELNPHHFAAWQGMAACQVRQGDVEEACRSLRRALQIKPHDGAAREFLKHCEALLDPRPREGATSTFEV